MIAAVDPESEQAFLDNQTFPPIKSYNIGKDYKKLRHLLEYLIGSKRVCNIHPGLMVDHRLAVRSELP